MLGIMCVKALQGLKIISPHGISLATDVASIINWQGHKVIPLFHPGPRAMIHRPRVQQQDDYAQLADQILRADNDV